LVPFQCFITNGAVITSDVTGRVATAGNTVLTLSTTGGAGTFTITLGSGCTGTVTSGTATITGSVLALIAGANTVTSNGAGNCTMNLTLGTAANTNDVNTYSATSGGVSGASIPTSADNFYADANSFTAASQVVTVDATASCLSMDWTGATNSPQFTLYASDYLQIYGNLTLISGMNITIPAWGFRFRGATTGKTVTSAGKSLGAMVFYETGGGWTLQDNLTSVSLFCYQGTLNTNGKTVVTASSGDLGGASTITLGATSLTTTAWAVTASTTLTANTSTINCSGNASFGGITTYNVFNLTGATSTFTGNATAHTIGFTRAGVQTITATGTTITATNFVRDAGTSVKTIVNGTFVKTSSGRIILPYYSISGATFSPLGVWYFPKSTDGGTNTGANFTYPVMGAGWWVLSH
jgi:hypothetical protein